MLRPNQEKCLKLMFETNMHDKDIAAAIHVTPKTICEWKKKDKEFQEAYKSMIDKGLLYAASKAFRKQVNLLDNDNAMVAHLAAKDILSRGGFNPTEKTEQQVDMNLNINIDYGDEQG